MLCARSCPALRDHVNCSPPGSSGHGILQARMLEWVARPLVWASPTQGFNPRLLHLLHCRQILFPTHQSHDWSYTREKHTSKRHVHTSAGLFTSAKTRKQLKCLDRGVDKDDVVHIYVGYSSAIKRDEIGSFVRMWMDIETVIQSEISPKEKNKYHILTHTCGI